MIYLVQRFHIQHKVSKFCWKASVGESNDQVTLSQTCKLLFEYTHNQQLVEVKSRKCVKSEGFVNGSPIMLSNDCLGKDSKWDWSTDHLKLAGSGMCIHIYSKNKTVVEGKKIVLHSGCGSDVNNFQRLPGRFTIPIYFLLDVYYSINVGIPF